MKRHHRRAAHLLPLAPVPGANAESTSSTSTSSSASFEVIIDEDSRANHLLSHSMATPTTKRDTERVSQVLTSEPCAQDSVPLEHMPPPSRLKYVLHSLQPSPDGLLIAFTEGLFEDSVEGWPAGGEYQRLHAAASIGDGGAVAVVTSSRPLLHGLTRAPATQHKDDANQEAKEPSERADSGAHCLRHGPHTLHVMDAATGLPVTASIEGRRSP